MIFIDERQLMLVLLVPTTCHGYSKFSCSPVTTQDKAGFSSLLGLVHQDEPTQNLTSHNRAP